MDVVNASSRRTSSGAIEQIGTTPLLRVDGLVESPQSLRPEDLASLAHISCAEDFHCEHSGTSPNQVWQGPSLLEIIRLASPRSDAKYVRVHAQNYSVPLALDEIEGALLAESLNGQPLSPERGAPWRLYVPGAHCHVSVKWVDRLELTAGRGSTSAERAARARVRGQIVTNSTLETGQS
jgi:DMSO/TMAO reductase YedYZ molybdopterin-dependent catalytic subunit